MTRRIQISTRLCGCRIDPKLKNLHNSGAADGLNLMKRAMIGKVSASEKISQVN